MKLSSVTIKNFRALSDITVQLDDTTVLIGENNSGKTSFLEALKLCLAPGAARRGDAFEDYDHHLASDASQVGDAGATELILRFCESSVGEWPDEVIQTLLEAISLTGELQQVALSLKSAKDAGSGEMQTTWAFLDAAGNPLRPKRPAAVILRDLQRIKPFFYLSALRDATREFQPKSAFWGPFLRNPSISTELRDELESQLNELNNKVIESDEKLRDVRARLEKTGDIVSLNSAPNTVTIEAVPSKARDLLSRAQVSITGRTGAKLPMVRHGAGTQSMSVFFLFESFLATMLERTFGEGAAPIVAIEEPEAHLHPSATRSLWATLSTLPGQKVISTHSGDLLAKVPLENVRRFTYGPNGVVVHQLNDGILSASDKRKIELHVRATRGELLFARVWLLVEGATEHWVLTGLADLMGVDLDREGVRIVPYATIGLVTLIKLADCLGIGWFCLADGDSEGLKYKKLAEQQLGSRPAAAHVLALPNANVEVHLAVAGFGSPYAANVATQKASQIVEPAGTITYWEQVCKAQGNAKRKEDLALEVLDEMRKGTAPLPVVLTGVINAVRRLARGGTDAP